MEQYTSEDARKEWRRILNEVERGEPVGITRYGKPLAVVMHAGWPAICAQAIAAELETAAISEWEDDRSNYAKVIEIYMDQVTSIVGKVLRKAAGEPLTGGADISEEK